MKNSKSYIFLLIFILSIVVAACSGGGSDGGEAESDSGGETYEFKLGFNSSLDNSPHGVASQTFADYVEKETNGQVTFEMFPDEVYGSALEMAEAVQIGALDMMVIGAVELAESVPEYDLFTLPFLFEDAEEAHAIMDSEIGNELYKLAEEQGYKVLGDSDLGFAQITNSKQVVTEPEDLEGLKIRSSNNEILIETFDALGASVSTMPYSEIYNGLSQGVVDGQFNPLRNILDQQLYEVQDYLTITNHAFYTGFLVVNLDTFNNLDEELQQVFIEAGEKASEATRAYSNDVFEEDLAEARELFEEVSTDPDLEAFRDKTRAVHDNMKDSIGEDLISETHKFLDEYRQTK